MKNVIESQITLGGYAHDKEDPDLLVNTHIVISEKNTSQSNYPAYYPFYFGIYSAQYGSVTTTRQNEGGVVIELADKENHQLVWQGYAPEVLHEKAKDRVAEISDTVALIFASYTHRAENSDAVDPI